MNRFAVAAIVVLLAACNAGATPPSEQALPTVSASSSTAALPSASASAAAMSCEDAFADIDLGDVDASTDLNTLSAQLDATVAGCPSINDWTAALQAAAPNVSLTSALAFLQVRCADNPELADTALCAQVGLGT
jgi:hypothetical protein